MLHAGFTLTELVVVIAIVGMLATLVIPSFVGVREAARLALCASSMRGVVAGLTGYAAVNRCRLPPFAFSDHLGNLPLSGHWGGVSQPGDPAGFGRRPSGNSVAYVNLWVLVRDEAVSPGRLICPAAAAELQNGEASYFTYTRRYSTYCLRFPPSEDLFRRSPELAYEGGDLLGIYAQSAGGQRVRTSTTGQYRRTVPQVRIDYRYATVDAAACGDGEYNASGDTILADSFWRRAFSQDADGAAGLQSYPVRADWCHGSRFNAARGDGSVRTVSDDGTVQANSISPGEPLADDGLYYATYAERIWQFFDAAR